MYVYADMTAYKGTWDSGCMNGVEHPLLDAHLPPEVKKIHMLNDSHTESVEILRQMVVARQGPKSKSVANTSLGRS
jgi:hypothetical protein